MPTQFAALFPGQGAQSIGMLSSLAATSTAVRDCFGQASDALGFDLWALVQEGPEAQLNLTEYTQPAMLVAGVAAWRAWLEAGGPQPSAAAGHSLGEYSALVCAQVLQLDEAAALVRERGRLMQQAVPEGVGAIAAVLGLEDERVIEICAATAGDQVVQAVNFNSPNQVVIAGHVAAVDRALEAAKSAGAKRAVRLPVSVPVHSRLMDSAAREFAARVDEAHLREPVIPVVQNVEARAYDSLDEIRDALRRHVNSPVRWAASVRAMAAGGSHTFVEFGPGKVLSGLCKRIDRGLAAMGVEDPDSLRQALDRIAGGEA